MDAFFRGLLVVGALASLGAGFRTPNFVVTAPTAEFAKQVGEAAEIYRDELAIEWLGKPLPGKWSSPCPITVKVGSMGAGGATTFNFQNGEVYGWQMDIQGSEERILDSVLPHEINHTIFACYFRRPLPRWADEGAASLIEHGSERLRLRKIHDQVMGTSRKIPLKTLLDMKNYPQDKQQVLTLYAEGHSLADFLIQKSDKPSYIKFLQVAHEAGWEEALKRYEYPSIDALEKDWDQWVLASCPTLNVPAGTQLASNKQPATKNGTTIRGQSPEATPTPGNAKSLAGKTLPAVKPERPSMVELDQAASPVEIVVNTQPLRRDGLQVPLLTQPAPSGAARVPREGLIPLLPRSR
ncbi:MAG: hypothetical protein AABP62_00075 [Planctomycetota bacterium]